MGRRITEERAAEALAAHTEGLIGRRQAMPPIALTDEECEELAPLFRLAEHLYQNMQPVQPSAAFVRTLGKELAKNAQRQVVLAKRARKRLVIGAAAVGSLVSIASIVGTIVFVIVRWRARSHAHTAGV